MKNKGKTALITGATSGIGLELAKLFANDGYDLVIVARDRKELDATEKELKDGYKITVTAIKKDLFEPQSPFDLYDEVKEKDIEINVLVNNAGHGLYGEFLDTDLNMELDIIQLNICSLVVLTKLYMKDMTEKGEGKILNVSSVASKSPGPWHSVYHGTKAFVQSFTEAIRYEIKDRGITVTALLPGATDTDFFQKAHMENAKSIQDKSKLADPADVAKDGYEALMAGKDMVVSGLQNKLEVFKSKITSDEKNAEKMAKHQEPADYKK